jgi:acyl carrier protein
VVVVGSLPRTPTGKLDRMSLAASISPERTVCTVSMPSDGERIVAEIFAAVLEVGSVGVEDNFFALGGDSLRANMVIGRLDRQFGVRLSVMSFFRAPTVRGVVAQLAGARSHAAPEISARAG